MAAQFSARSIASSSVAVGTEDFEQALDATGPPEYYDMNGDGREDATFTLAGNLTPDVVASGKPFYARWTTDTDGLPRRGSRRARSRASSTKRSRTICRRASRPTRGTAAHGSIAPALGTGAPRRLRRHGPPGGAPDRWLATCGMAHCTVRSRSVLTDLSVPTRVEGKAVTGSWRSCDKADPEPWGPASPTLSLRGQRQTPPDGTTRRAPAPSPCRSAPR
jgi:hypothetical protein